jgi:hypothetical protein
MSITVLDLVKNSEIGDLSIDEQIKIQGGIYIVSYPHTDGSIFPGNQEIIPPIGGKFFLC